VAWRLGVSQKGTANLTVISIIDEISRTPTRWRGFKTQRRQDGWLMADD
jgi:hypothetical protein